MVRQSQGFQLVQSALDAASQLLVCHIVRITQGWVNDILVEDVKDFSQNPVKFGSEPVPSSKARRRAVSQPVAKSGAEMVAPASCRIRLTCSAVAAPGSTSDGRAHALGRDGDTSRCDSELVICAPGRDPRERDRRPGAAPPNHHSSHPPVSLLAMKRCRIRIVGHPAASSSSSSSTGKTWRKLAMADGTTFGSVSNGRTRRRRVSGRATAASRTGSRRSSGGTRTAVEALQVAPARRALPCRYPSMILRCVGQAVEGKGAAAIPERAGPTRRHDDRPTVAVQPVQIRPGISRTARGTSQLSRILRKRRTSGKCCQLLPVEVPSFLGVGTAMEPAFRDLRLPLPRPRHRRPRRDRPRGSPGWPRPRRPSRC
jgi:hypothetical protein